MIFPKTILSIVEIRDEALGETHCNMCFNGNSFNYWGHLVSSCGFQSINPNAAQNLSSNKTLLVAIKTMRINTFYHWRCFNVVFVFETFLTQEVVKMLKNLVNGWRIKQTFIASSFNFCRVSFETYGLWLS